MPTSAFLGWLSGTDVCSIILWSISSILIVLCVYIIIKKEYKKLLYAGPFAISLIALSLFFGNRYSDYEAKGDCLFRPSAALYTKWGKCVIEDFGDFEYISDDDSHDLSRWDFHIPSEAENAVNGPYFYKMEKLTVYLDDEGESYSYDDSYDKVYYDYKAYDVEYKFSIYNSKGDWAGEYSVSEYFFYFPDKKVIDGTSYKYEMNGEDFRTSWKFADKLHESVKSQLHDYIVEMAENLAQQTTIVGNSPSATVDNPSSYTEETKEPYVPQKYEREVPVQRFHECVGCFGGGLCQYCLGSGTIYYPTGPATCAVCGGYGRCSMCAGRGGEYVTEYETIVEYY
jgi:hypothetical protein